jgi:hypothetical protein
MIDQASQDTWLHWLYTDAPAAWLSALAAFIAFVLALRSRKKPKRLVVREIRNSSLIRIWPSIRPKIKMTFDDQPINRSPKSKPRYLTRARRRLRMLRSLSPCPTNASCLAFQLLRRNCWRKRRLAPTA